MEMKRCPKCCKTLPTSDYASNKCKNRKSQISAYCKPCLCKITSDKHYSFKRKCLEILSNKCIKCGYDKCIAVLEFHHTDPTKKDFTICTKFKNYANVNEEVIRELKKCIVLCANCHRETHFNE